VGMAPISGKTETLASLSGPSMATFRNSNSFARIPDPAEPAVPAEPHEQVLGQVGLL
jgi:hypothetical protein